MRDDPRSVMGDQFQITLPADWRNAQDVKKGDKVYAHYKPESALIITSESRPLTALENNIIDILIRLPDLERTKELAEELRTAADTIETIMITPVYCTRDEK